MTSEQSTTYLLVSAVRIQGWISRTPKLKHVRGASAALIWATSPEQLQGVITGQATWCVEAGEISGVVALKVTTGSPEALADAVVEALRPHLPAIELEAWWTSAPDYVTAFARWSHETVTGRWSEHVGRKTYLPAPAGVPLAQSCAGCRREPVIQDAQVTNPTLTGLGADCAARVRHSEAAPMPPGLDGRPAQDFEELARCGGVGPGGERLDTPIGRAGSNNHLATVAADGNGVGGFMRALAAPLPGGSADTNLALGALRRAVPQLLAAAISEAVRYACSGQVGLQSGISVPGQPVVPVIVHLQGGDDVLATVSAPLVWRFVTRLGEAFESQIESLLLGSSELDALVSAAEADQPEVLGAVEGIRARCERLSLGVGVVIAHASHPFADTQALAHRAMEQAKDAVSGSRSAVSWVDLTSEETIVPGRSIEVHTLQIQLADPAKSAPVFTLSASARGVLGTILADWLADPTMATQVGGELRAWSHRTNQSLPGSLDQNARGDAHEADLIQLRDDLSRVRWWPAHATVGVSNV